MKELENDMDFGLKKETVAKIGSVFDNFPAIEQVLIYGSRAKGNYRRGSDIDLVLVGEKLTTTDLLKIENDLDDLMLPYMIDLSIYHQIDNDALTEHIKRVGKVFYQKLNV